MRIAERVHIPLAAIEPHWHLDEVNIARGFEVARLPRLDLVIAGLA
jgi:hypothetical protein